MTPVKTDFGKRDGWEVSAITDDLGAQVVIHQGEGKERVSKLSPVQKDHEAAVALAQRVMNEGIEIIQWQQPANSIGELMSRILFNRMR